MKKVMHAAVFASLLASASAFAHHPAEAIIDPDTWAMIDQNLQDADSPHLDLDTMGSASASGSGSGGGGSNSAGRSSSGSGRGQGGASGSGSGRGTGGSRR